MEYETLSEDSEEPAEPLDAPEDLGVGCRRLDVETTVREPARADVPNPEGKNQFPHCPPKNCPRFQELLRSYHCITTNTQLVSDLLAREHGITVSIRTIARRWKELGLKASRATEASLPPGQAIRIIVDQMALNPSGRMGQNAMKRQIALETGVHLKRKTVARVQRLMDPEAATARNPTSRQFRRIPLTSKGPNEVWCMDGHDKLCKYGFAIWGIRDKFSRKWLGLWVVPNNRLQDVVAYLWLSLVRDSGGVPIQSSSDCGSENLFICKLATSLRDALHAGTTETPPHVFLRSVHHIPIERGWLGLRQDLGHDFPHFWAAGADVFDDNDADHHYLAMWLWPPLMQRELDKFCFSANNRQMRKQRDKLLPSGVTPNVAHTLPERFGGEDCLQPVDRQVIQEIMDEMRENYDALTDWGVPPEFAARAAAACDRLQVHEVTLMNVWVVFSSILQAM